MVLRRVVLRRRFRGIKASRRRGLVIKKKIKKPKILKDFEASDLILTAKGKLDPKVLKQMEEELSGKRRFRKP